LIRNKPSGEGGRRGGKQKGRKGEGGGEGGERRRNFHLASVASRAGGDNRNRACIYMSNILKPEKKINLKSLIQLYRQEFL
jgi:hypothetical protein